CMCGLAFASKPNVGLLAFGAVCVSIAATRGRRFFHCGRELAVAGVAFATAGFVGVILPVLLTRSWAPFVSQVFGEKTQYVQAGFSYLHSLERNVMTLTSSDQGGGRVPGVHVIIAALPLLVVVVLVWGFWRAPRRNRHLLVICSAFAACALASTFP